MSVEERRELNEGFAYESYWERSEARKPECTFCGARVDSVWEPCPQCDRYEEAAWATSS